MKLKAAKRRAETGDPTIKSIYERENGDMPRWVIIRKTLMRPLKLLILSPIVFLVGLVGAVGMSLVYVVITSLPEIYEERYHFDKGPIGLTYFGLGMSQRKTFLLT